MIVMSNVFCHKYFDIISMSLLYMLRQILETIVKQKYFVFRISNVSNCRIVISYYAFYLTSHMYITFFSLHHNFKSCKSGRLLMCIR